MSAFYGQVIGGANTTASRRGYDSIKVSAQSWNGSLITRMWYDHDELMVELQHNTGSDSSGYTVFCGSLDDLISTLKK